MSNGKRYQGITFVSPEIKKLYARIDEKRRMHRVKQKLNAGPKNRVVRFALDQKINECKDIMKLIRQQFAE